VAVTWGTPDHPFWVDAKWKPLAEVKVGDSLVMISGYKSAVTGIKIIDTLATVYNFTVANSHTYYVSSAGILVHNDCWKMRMMRVGDIKLVHPESTITSKESYKAIRALSNEDLIKSAMKPADGSLIKINPVTGRAMNGNTRVFEMQRRGLNDVMVPYEMHMPDNSMFWDL
jgi:hypothetical protein